MHASATPSLLAAALAGGLVLGAGYFAALRRAVRTHAAGGSAVGFAALMIVRIIAAAAGLALAARWGPPSLVAALGGFLLARAFAVRAVRSGA